MAETTGEALAALALPHGELGAIAPAAPANGRSDEHSRNPEGARDDRRAGECAAGSGVSEEA